MEFEPDGEMQFDEGEEIIVNKKRFYLSQENTFVMAFDNPLLDGIFFNLDEESYAYMTPAHESYDTIMDICEEQECVLWEQEGQEIDFDDPPFNWILKSVINFLQAEAEELLDES